MLRSGQCTRSTLLLWRAFFIAACNLSAGGASVRHRQPGGRRAAAREVASVNGALSEDEIFFRERRHPQTRSSNNDDKESRASIAGMEAYQ